MARYIAYSHEEACFLRGENTTRGGNPIAPNNRVEKTSPAFAAMGSRARNDVGDKDFSLHVLNEPVMSFLVIIIISYIYN